MLVDANRWVSAEQLMLRVWGEQLPHCGKQTLYSYLSRLRHALSDVDMTITRRVGGWVLSADIDSVDLHLFRKLLARSRATEEPAAALAALEKALDLWNGEAFTGLATEWLDGVRNHLTSERFSAELDRIDLLLAVGRHAEAVPELERRTREHPLDERIAGQYMLALVRNGRQSDALEHFQRTRKLLAADLGTDPSQPLCELHQRILVADPGLAPVQAPARASVPCRLPPPPRHFVGRAQELHSLTESMETAAGDGSVPITVITGTGGVGKTWLALHWAHCHQDRFPDGMLHVNLRGFARDAEPTPASTAVRAFLDALGVAAQGIPDDLDAQVNLYRDLVAGKRMLILMDNAADTDHVVPLLPGSSACMVLITSRRRLTGLATTHGALLLDLDVLDEDEALQLLEGRVGSGRVAAEPEATAEVLTACGGLPLAIGIVAARANASPSFPLAVLAEELRDQANRLDALDAGELSTNLRAVLSSSCAALSDEAAFVFAGLALAPGPDIGFPAAMRLLDRPAAQLRVLLRELEHAHLLQQHAPGRYRMHDLVRLYAAERAQHDWTADDQDAGLRRLVEFLLRTTYAAESLVDPFRPWFTLPEPDPGYVPHCMTTAAEAREWFRTEYANLLAAHASAVERAWHSSVWGLTWSLGTSHRWRGNHHEMVGVWEAGKHAADQQGDPATRAAARRLLGAACGRVRRFADGAAYLTEALAIAKSIGDLAEQAHAHRALAVILAKMGDNRRALRHCTRALALYRTLGEPVWEADALNGVGWYHAQLGDYAPARTYCEAALPLARAHSFHDLEAATLDSLAYIAQHTGRLRDALRHYCQGRALFRQLDNSYQEANTLDRLAHLHHALGQHDQAVAAWTQALHLFQAHSRTAEAASVQSHLAQIADVSGEVPSVDCGTPPR
ncbi:BTAD domain-containing putative transcriptional regulator [Actinokineospora sp. NPDC004072]